MKKINKSNEIEKFKKKFDLYSKTSSIEKKDNQLYISVVSSDNNDGVDVYFDESNTYTEKSTQKEDIDPNFLISNSHIKQALLKNEDTYNSLEQEFIINRPEKPSEINISKSISQTSRGNIIINLNDQKLPPQMNSNILSSIVDEDMSLYTKNGEVFVKKQIFQKKPYDLSTRLINDEDYAKGTGLNLSNTYKFMSKLNEKKTCDIRLNLAKFLILKKELIMKIISFCYEEIDEIRKAGRCIEKKINGVLSASYFCIVDKFKKTYENELELYEFFFKTGRDFYQKNIKQNNRNPFDQYLLLSRLSNRKKYNPKNSLNLYIKAKINSCNKPGESLTLNLVYNLLGEKSSFLSSFSFDISDSNVLSSWIASESEEYNTTYRRFVYRIPIQTFRIGDYIVIKITLMSLEGIFDSGKFEWIKMQNSYIGNKKTFIQMSKSLCRNFNKKTEKEFDKLRFCEIERMVHIWKSVEGLTKKYFVNDIKKIFDNLFDIEEFQYDVRKFYLFRINLKAKRVGLLKMNRYFNFDIEIKGSQDCVINQVQSLGLLNFVELGSLQIRVGDILVCYFSEIYG